MAASFDQANGVGTKTASSTSHTVNYPTTVQDDIIIVTFAANGVTSVTPPTGSISWTQIFFDNTGNASLGAWWGKQIASPVSSGSWTTSSPARQGTWWAVEATGVDTTDPVDEVGTVNSGTSTGPTHGGITPNTTDTALMYLHCARAQSVSGLTAPTGMTEHYDDGTSGGGSAALYVAGQDLASASATGSRTPSALPSSVPWTANLFTLAPSGGAAQTITLPAPLSPVTILAPTVANQAAQTITLPAPLTPVTILAPTVALAGGAQTITLGSPLSPVTILAPTVALQASDTITLPAPLTPVTILAPTIALQASQTLTLPAPLSPVTVLAPTVALQASLTVTLPSPLSPVTIFAPTVTLVATQTIILPVLSPVTIYAPVIVGGEQTPSTTPPLFVVLGASGGDIVPTDTGVTTIEGVSSWTDLVGDTSLGNVT